MTKVKFSQIPELKELRRQGRKLVHTEFKLGQVGQLKKFRWQFKQILTIQIKLCCPSLRRLFNQT